MWRSAGGQGEDDVEKLGELAKTKCCLGDDQEETSQEKVQIQFCFSRSINISVLSIFLGH